MPYDLYGTYYATSKEANAAETAQCAEIDADYARREVDKLKRQMQYQQQPTQQGEEINNLWQYVEELERRILILENATRKVH